MILHTAERAAAARTVARVIVATDDERIRQVAADAGFEVAITNAEHRSGSDRVAEVAESLPEGSIVVNVQGDEPMIAPETIDAAVNALEDDPDADMSTTCEPITSVRRELLNGNVVKVVAGDNGYALYFSRSPMPFPREASLRYGGDPGRALDAEPELLRNFRKHTGLYAYRREYLLRFAKLPPTHLESIESLEQIRALEDGAKIRVAEAIAASIAVDTSRDLERVRILMEEMPIAFRTGVLSDVPEVSRVYVESVRCSFECVYPEAYLSGLSAKQRESTARARFEIQNYMLCLAETARGRLIGFADSGQPVIDGVGYDRQIYSIYLLPEYQGLGVGRDLFRRCVSAIMETGGRSLCLDTIEASPYRRFYDKLGGIRIGDGVHRFGDIEMPTVIYGWHDLQAI